MKSREALLKLLVAPEKQVFDFLFANDEVLYVNWRYREDAIEAAPHTNVLIAAYTTAQARMKLYEHLEKLGRRLLYYDTESCIFVSRDDEAREYSPPLGSLLGDMTDELKSFGYGTYIKTFLIGGPKFYSFQAFCPGSGKIFESCKVKGISLNFMNSMRINLDSIRYLIEKYFDEQDGNESDEGGAIKLNFKAVRRMQTHEVVTRNETKTYCVVLKKRHFVKPDLSLPFGYKDVIM